jgi:hypothetical protein
MTAFTEACCAGTEASLALFSIGWLVGKLTIEPETVASGAS